MRPSRIALLFLCLGITLAAGLAVKFFAPFAEPGNAKAYTATYKDSSGQWTGTIGDISIISSDGAGHIRMGGPESPTFTIFDYKKRATFHVKKKEKVFTHAEMINPDFPTPFSSPAKLDERSLSWIAFYVGSGKDQGYDGHHYVSLPFADIQMDCWFAPELNCCTTYIVDGGMIGTQNSKLIKYSKEPPDPKLFDLSDYREILPKDYYYYY